MHFQETVNTSGCVRWPRPRNRFKINNEWVPEPGAMWVTAFWLADFRPAERIVDLGAFLKGADRSVRYVMCDPFLYANNAAHAIALPLPDQTIGFDAESVYPDSKKVPAVPPGPDRKGRERYLDYLRDAGNPVIAAVTLATADAVFRRNDGLKEWVATSDDLTFRGRRLVAGLDRLYGRQARIVTYVDYVGDDPTD